MYAVGATGDGTTGLQSVSGRNGGSDKLSDFSYPSRTLQAPRECNLSLYSHPTAAPGQLNAIYRRFCCLQKVETVQTAFVHLESPLSLFRLEVPDCQEAALTGICRTQLTAHQSSFVSQICPMETALPSGKWVPDEQAAFTLNTLAWSLPLPPPTKSPSGRTTDSSLTISLSLREREE